MTVQDPLLEQPERDDAPVSRDEDERACRVREAMDRFMSDPDTVAVLAELAKR